MDPAYSQPRASDEDTLGKFIPNNSDLMLDALSEDVIASIEVRDRALNDLAHTLGLVARSSLWRTR